MNKEFESDIDEVEVEDVSDVEEVEEVVGVVEDELEDELEAYECEYTEDLLGANSDSDQEECRHLTSTTIDGNTICVDCNQKLDEALLDNETRYYGAADTRYNKDPSRHNPRKEEERSLHSDLEPLGFPQDVIERANDYYKIIIKDKIYRAGNRLSIVFACTYHAYIDIGEPRLPPDLAKPFKLDKKGISNGLKTFSKFFRKRPGKKYIDAMDLVPKLLADLGISSSQHSVCVEDIRKIYNYVITNAKSKTFNSSNPQSVAAGLVYFYLKLKDHSNGGKAIVRTEFSKTVKLTDITFTRIARDIDNLLQPGYDLRF